MFLDGYVTLSGGSGVASDVTKTPYDVDNDGQIETGEIGITPIANTTTMRWAQAFCDETSNVISNCTTVGKTTNGASSTTTTSQTTAVTSGIIANWATLDDTSLDEDAVGQNVSNIKTNI